MMNTISPADAAFERMRSGLGTCFIGGGTAVRRHLTDRMAILLPVPDWAQGIAMPFARPQSRKTVYLPGYGAQAGAKARPAEIARQQRTSKVQNAHLTHVATRLSYIKGGAPLGPHPARNPV